MSFTSDSSDDGMTKKEKVALKKNARLFDELLDSAPDMEKIYKKARFDNKTLTEQSKLLYEMESTVNDYRNRLLVRFNGLQDDLHNKKIFDFKSFKGLGMDDAEQYLKDMEDRRTEEEKAIDTITKIYNKHVRNVRAKHWNGVPALGTLAIQPVGGNAMAYATIQLLGQRHGCWTCGAEMGDDDAANWVADHIPPYALSEKVIDEINATYRKKFVYGHYTLYPSCVDCSRKQSSLVNAIKTAFKSKTNTKAIDDFLKTKDQRRMIMGGSGQKGVPTTSKKTFAVKQVWKTRTNFYCHICDAETSTSDDTAYTADHYPPREFNTAYAQAAFAAAGLKVEDPMLYPQCIKCSSKQGSLSSDSLALINAARVLGITVNK